MYELKGPLILINSLISVSDYSIGLFLQAILYSAYSTNFFLLKTYTLLYWSSSLSPLIIDLLASSQYTSYKFLSLKLCLIYLLILKLIQLVMSFIVVLLVKVILLPQSRYQISMLNIINQYRLQCLQLIKAVKRKGIHQRLRRVINVIFNIVDLQGSRQY